jgi:hypothetical protein
LELLAQCLIARSARADRASEAAAFLSHSQTKSLSAHSFFQDSGARSWALWIRRRRRRSQRNNASVRFSSVRRRAISDARSYDD